MTIMNILDLTQKLSEKINETADKLREDETEAALEALEAALDELGELDRCLCEMATYTEQDAKKGDMERIIKRFIIP